MTDRPLSYNVLKSIFANLSLDKRIEIIKQCPSLKTVERRAILQLDRLLLTDWHLTVNDLEYSTYGRSHSSESERVICLMVRKNDAEVLSKEFKLKSRELLQKILDFYLADREVVRIKLLEIASGIPVSPRLPEALKIECKELRVHHRHSTYFDQQRSAQQVDTIHTIQSFLTDAPLEKMYIHADEAQDPIFQKELVRNVKYLEIKKESGWRDSIVTGFAGLNCNHIHVSARKYSFLKQDNVQLARLWLETCPKLGTRFTLTVCEYEYVLDVMDQLIEELGAVRGEVLEEELKSTFFRHCVSIPMRSGHELNVFGGLPKERAYDIQWLLRMEVMEPSASIRK